ncbi:MAG: glutamine amidotransferase [Gemmatimonadota bacterium]
MDRLVELLFKFRPAAFTRGGVAFDGPISPWVVALLAVLAIAVAGVTYARHPGALSRGSRIALATLRAIAIVVVAVALVRPVLVLSTSIQQRNVVAVVVDDSRSMLVQDTEWGSRGDVVTRLAGGADSALLKALSERYQLRIFRLGSGGRQGDASGIRYDATRTRLAASLLRIEDDLTGVPTAGVVLLSDGADNSSATADAEPVADQMLSLRARQVPVYTVGIGRERFDRDLEVARVEAPRTLLRNASLFVQVVLMQRGYGGARVPIVVEDSGRIVGTATALLPRDGEAVSVRIRIPATEVGARLLEVKVPLQAGEMIAENNSRSMLVVVRDRREKILYVEGEPRFELKFLRKAVEADGNVQLVSLLRSAKDKFLRMGVDDSLELAAGFPRTREELFAYRAVILGSVEAAFFTADQLRMLGDFVSERGGGLLMLGGRDAFGEGGYGGTAVSDALPVELQGVAGDAPPLATLRATPTAAGGGHPALQLAATDSLSKARWATLPPLTSVNRLGRAKPGATILLNGVTADSVTSHALLAFQRYGRGKAIVFGAQDSWLWQMEASIPVDDQTHETFWRQMLRWLVSDVPDRAETLVAEESGPGEGIALRATVSDSGFLKANGATVQGTVTTPSGVTQDVALEWAVERDGEYRTTYVPQGTGVHEVRLHAVLGHDTVASEAAFVRVAPPTNEYFGAEMRPAMLRRIAEETGGRYYPAERALEVAKDMVYSPSGATVVEKKDLWDMPVLLVLLLATLGAEWALRRREGVA